MKDSEKRNIENMVKLHDMQKKALYENDTIVWNAINLFIRNNYDATVLIKEIKVMYEELKEYRSRYD